MNGFYWLQGTLLCLSLSLSDHSLFICLSVCMSLSLSVSTPQFLPVSVSFSFSMSLSVSACLCLSLFPCLCLLYTHRACALAHPRPVLLPSLFSGRPMLHVEQHVHAHDLRILAGTPVLGLILCKPLCYRKATWNSGKISYLKVKVNQESFSAP